MECMLSKYGDIITDDVLWCTDIERSKGELILQGSWFCDQPLDEYEQAYKYSVILFKIPSFTKRNKL